MLQLHKGRGTRSTSRGEKISGAARSKYVGGSVEGGKGEEGEEDCASQEAPTNEGH